MSSFSYGQHECFAKDLVTTFIVGLVRLVAGLKGLRPAPGQMGVVKTIQVGSEKAYLNDSWSYLSFDASSKFRRTRGSIFMILISWQPGKSTSMDMERERIKAMPRRTSPSIWGSTTT